MFIVEIWLLNGIIVQVIFYRNCEGTPRPSDENNFSIVKSKINIGKLERNKRNFQSVCDTAYSFARLSLPKINIKVFHSLHSLFRSIYINQYFQLQRKMKEKLPENTKKLYFMSKNILIDQKSEEIYPKY